MNEMNLNPTHVSDEDLVRMLDAEADPRERNSWEEHLGTCRECAERLDELDGAAKWLGENIAVLDLEHEVDELARARALAAIRTANRQSLQKEPRRVPLLRIAAAIGAVAVVGYSVQPVLAWVIDRVGRLGGIETVPAVVADAPIDAASAAVSFVPTNPVFRVELGTNQAEGVISIEVQPVESASAQVISGNGEGLTALPAGFRVENSSASEASYRIRVPAGSIRTVEVVAAGERIATSELNGTTQTIVVDLAKD